MNRESALYAGRVMHQRLRPARHRLRYRVFSLLLDLDELSAVSRSLRLFSLNRFNLFSLYEADYGSGDGRDLRIYVRQQLNEAGLAIDGPIRLLTMPRLLGYAFNPLSVYYCHGRGGALEAVLYEVNNTFGERHSYLIRVDPAASPAAVIEQQCRKQFHVSPFLALDMDYRFRVEAPRRDRDGLRIGITASDPAGPVLVAQLDATRQPLSDATLCRAFFTHPLLTLKVIVGIHWQALRLVIKGVRLQARPAAPIRAVTVVKPSDS